MNIVCLDMEGVLVPEIWIAFAEESGIPELRRTTRDEPDYDKLMRWRLGILKEHGLGLREIQQTIARIDPLPGAKDFLDALRREYPAQAGQSIPAEHPAGADIPAQAPAGDTGNCAGRNNPRTIPARGAWVPSVVSSAHPASNPAEHPAQGDEPAAREEVEQLRDALRSLSDVELAACLFHGAPASSDARPMSAVFLREMSRRDPVRSFATFKAWRAGDIPPDVRALLDSLADGDPDAGGD